jgi:hypothetical protein
MYSGSSFGSGSAIVDTGTTLIQIPTSAYNKFLSAARSSTLSPAQYLVSSAEASNLGAQQRTLLVHRGRWHLVSILCCSSPFFSN